MIKKISVFIAILGLVFVGIPRPTVNASHATGNAYYLSIKWEFWDYDSVVEDYNYRILQADYNPDLVPGPDFQNVSNEWLDNKTTFWGSKDVVLNLGGTYEVWFVDHWNMPNSNNRYYFGPTDTILIQSNMIIGNDNGKRYFKTKSSLLNDLDSDMFYIVIENLDAQYDMGFNAGKQSGINQGKELGKQEYGINFNGLWRTAEWYGNYRYNKGLSENVEAGGFGMLLSSAFTAVGAFLSIELLPNISIGALVAIPVVFGVVMFIIGRRKE